MNSRVQSYVKDRRRGEEKEREREREETTEDRVLFPLQIFIFRSALECCLLRYRALLSCSV